MCLLFQEMTLAMKGRYYFYIIDSTRLHLDRASSLKPTTHIKKKKKSKNKYKKLSRNMELQQQLDQLKLNQNL